MRKLISAISVLALGLSLSVVSTNSALAGSSNSAVVDKFPPIVVDLTEISLPSEIFVREPRFDSGKLTIKFSTLTNSQNGKLSIDVSTSNVKIIDAYGTKYVGSLNGKLTLQEGENRSTNISASGKFTLNQLGSGRVASLAIHFRFVETPNGRIVLEKITFPGNLILL